MKYLYESHLGGVYIDNYILSEDDLYCDSCGDGDLFLGGFDTVSDLWNLLKGGYYTLQYLYPIIVNEFELPYPVQYEDVHAKSVGVCSNSDQEITANILDAIKKESKVE